MKKFPYSVIVNHYFHSSESVDMVNWCLDTLGRYNRAWRRTRGRGFRWPIVTCFYFKDRDDQMKFSLRFL